jgi:hypothetical protein
MLKFLLTTGILMLSLLMLFGCGPGIEEQQEVTILFEMPG